ncbi:MAG: regulatory protein RecX [Candidatus Omnitrophica bacterium]|nr:regulatory protein RecX [Candidatus Omnitrophota bacterium]
MNKDPSSKALRSCYRLLAVRDRSEKELKARLKTKGYSDRRIDEAIGCLKDKDLLDDARFARDWIKNRAAFRPKGLLALKNELVRKGVDAGIIDSVIKEEELGYNEYETAKSLTDRKIETLGGQNGLKRKKTIYDYLARRGFSFDVINDIVDRI